MPLAHMNTSSATEVCLGVEPATRKFTGFTFAVVYMIYSLFLFGIGKEW